MLEKDLVYELFKDKDKVCESYIWCVFLEKLNSLNKDSQLRGMVLQMRELPPCPDALPALIRSKN